GDEALLEWVHRFGTETDHGFRRYGLHPFRIPAVFAEATLDLASLRPIADALALLKQLHRRRNYVPVSQTLHQLLGATRAHVGFALRTGGEQALANAFHVAELARQFEAGGGISFRGFVEELRVAAANAVAAEAPILEEDSDGVRMMTVHKAKGLEFPIVILADLTCKLARAEAGRWIDPESGTCALKLGGWAPTELLLHDAEESARDRAEGERLAYVAATRARDVLIVPAVGDEVYDGGWLDPLMPAIYPPLDWRRHPMPAPGCPAFPSKDTVLTRGDGDPAKPTTVAPGQFTFGAPRSDGAHEGTRDPGPGSRRGGDQGSGIRDQGSGIGDANDKARVVSSEQATVLAFPSSRDAAARKGSESAERRAPSADVSPAGGPTPSADNPAPDPGSPIPDPDSYEVVWWDPHALALESPQVGGLRRDDLIAKDGDQAGVERRMGEYRAWQTDRAAAVSHARTPTIVAHTATELAREPLRPSAEPVRIEVVDLPRVPGRPFGPRFGSLVHATIATVALDAAAEAVLTTARTHARVLVAGEAEAAAAGDAVIRALQEPLFDEVRAAHAAGTCLRECPILWKQPDGAILEGTVDVVYAHGDGFTILDFKTDRDPSELKDQYERQLRLYCQAFAALRGTPVRGVLVRI
ncbi:MAG: 3'-5' exonuclease, partial [Vicinamibacterales bacterium]